MAEEKMLRKLGPYTVAVDLEPVTNEINNVRNELDAMVNDAVTSPESTWSSEKIGTEIDKANTVAISDTEPINENVAVWIPESTPSEINLPEIDDASVSEVDTWSSKKINDELTAIRASITGILEGSF